MADGDIKQNQLIRCEIQGNEAEIGVHFNLDDNLGNYLIASKIELILFVRKSPFIDRCQIIFFM